MSKPTRPPPDDDEEDLLDDDAPTADDPTPTTPDRVRPLVEELLLDEDALLDSPAEDLLDEDAWPDDPGLHRLPPLPWDDADEEDLAPPAAQERPDSDGPADREVLADEDALASAWLVDDGLVRDDGEVDLVPPAAPQRGLRAGQLVAGHEEWATLLDLGGVRLPAILATGMAESALSVPLHKLDDGRVELTLSGTTHRFDARGLRTHIQLGSCTLTAHLRLVDGAAPRLVLGRRALAGYVVVDPDAHHLLGDDSPGEA